MRAAQTRTKKEWNNAEDKIWIVQELEVVASFCPPLTIIARVA
jgi:hypothetical protein